MSDYFHPRLDERGALMSAVNAAGGKVVYSRETVDAVLYRLRFDHSMTD